ncbi:uncharacterized protein LOC108700251 [Xenopus laevis]|uniref:Uncharacterized protein LOC108700251 n=2 Tax=Xenopus laevis TaxID=8355 RepID=A0A1L8F3S5_XENLA|nr:uncharacterized protein LOC108700251 [Xenopus laevis]XP_018088771.1 uncharacterized protein LOC108700251 [Xenopus laevis]OCT66243.1 hypothetical protein XELAEV_18042501mg [Xenopus laevis]
MARLLNDRKPSEPVGNIQVETSPAFPAGVAETPCGGICEQNLPSSHPSTTNHSHPSFLQINPCQIRLGAESNCEESGPSSAPCANSHCHFSGCYNTGESTALSLTHSLSENSGMEDNVRILNQEDFAGDIEGGAMVLAGEEDLEREIAMRLRLIGDQMNELYMQRRIGGERHWWGPLRWRLTQFISEILSALYNPLIDILPQH